MPWKLYRRQYEVINNGAIIFQCFYGLEKAFDYMEYIVLLDHLYKTGINEKTWRVISAFYDNLDTMVCIDGRVSDKFSLGRGVQQGSILSPLLFLLVIDALLLA